MKTGLLIFSLSLLFLSCQEEQPKTKVEIKPKVIINKKLEKKSNVVRMATVDWPPFYSPSLKNGGPLTSIVREALKREGLEMSLKFIPWKSAVEMSKAGKYDALFGALWTKERAEALEYSEPMLSYTNRLIALKSSTLVIDVTKGLKDLKDYKICMIRGFSIDPEFDKADYLKKIEVDTLQQCIKMLGKKRVDFVVENPLNYRYEYKKAYPGEEKNYKFVGKPFKVSSLYVAFSKKVSQHKFWVGKLNEGLRKIKADGTFKKIVDSF